MIITQIRNSQINNWRLLPSFVSVMKLNRGSSHPTLFHFATYLPSGQFACYSVVQYFEGSKGYNGSSIVQERLLIWLSLVDHRSGSFLRMDVFTSHQKESSMCIFCFFFSELTVATDSLPTWKLNMIRFSNQPIVEIVGGCSNFQCSSFYFPTWNMFY